MVELTTPVVSCRDYGCENLRNKLGDLIATCNFKGTSGEVVEPGWLLQWYPLELFECPKLLHVLPAEVLDLWCDVGLSVCAIPTHRTRNVPPDRGD